MKHILSRENLLAMALAGMACQPGIATAQNIAVQVITGQPAQAKEAPTQNTPPKGPRPYTTASLNAAQLQKVTAPPPSPRATVQTMKLSPATVLSENANAYDREAEHLRFMGRTEDAIEAYSAALKIRQDIAGAYPNDSLAQQAVVTSHANIAEAWIIMGRLDKAYAEYLLIVDLESKLTVAFPEDVDARNILSSAYQQLGEIALKQGNSQASLAFYQKAQEQNEKSAYRDYPYAMQPSIKLADQKLSIGDDQGALAVYEATLNTLHRQQDDEWQRRLDAAMPRCFLIFCCPQPPAQPLAPDPSEAALYKKIGDIHRKFDEEAKARDAYQSEVAILKALVKNDDRVSGRTYWLALFEYASFDQTGPVWRQAITHADQMKKKGLWDARDEDNYVWALGQTKVAEARQKF